MSLRSLLFVPFLLSAAALSSAAAAGVEPSPAIPAPVASTSTATSVPETPHAAVMPTTATPLPQFDRWAKQPRLRCHVPAIRAWRVVWHYRAEPGGRRDTNLTLDQPQRILAQRPPGAGGITKYIVTYQSLRFDPSDRAAWIDLARKFARRYQSELQASNDFRSIDVDTPSITHTPRLQRFYLTYRVETTEGAEASGAFLAAPARHGVLFFNLELDGQTREALGTAMRELRPRVTRGLARSTRSWTPHIIALLLAVPVAAGAVLFYRRRVRVTRASRPVTRAQRRRRPRKSTH